ncbi:MAG: hypothetical protein IKU29_02055 [Parabacteroides sp.]|nr:hypothetical protein [Parabacteroides sp.]
MPPKEVKEYFCCSGCKSLTSLEGAPKEVGGIFDCSNCKSLTTLEGAPKKVGGDFSFDNNVRCGFKTVVRGFAFRM